MHTKEKIAGALVILTGAVLVCAGLLGTGFYIWGVVKSLGLSDKSFIFWGSVFILFGLPAFFAGVTMILIGFKSYRGSAAAYKVSLIFLGLIVLLTIAFIPIIYFRMQQVQQTEQEIMRSLERQQPPQYRTQQSL